MNNKKYHTVRTCPKTCRVQSMFHDYKPLSVFDIIIFCHYLNSMFRQKYLCIIILLGNWVRYNETCLNKISSNPKSCINQTSSNPESCINQTSSNPESCINQTSSNPKSCINQTSSNPESCINQTLNQIRMKENFVNSTYINRTPVYSERKSWSQGSSV